MGAGPGCAAGAGHAEAVSESVVELSEDVDVMDVSGLSAKQNRGSDQGGLLKLGFLIEVSMGERRKKGGNKVVFRMKMCSG